MCPSDDPIAGETVNNSCLLTQLGDDPRREHMAWYVPMTLANEPLGDLLMTFRSQQHAI
jgi:hypothetical protein